MSKKKKQLQLEDKQSKKNLPPCNVCHNSGWIIWFLNGPQAFPIPPEQEHQLPANKKILQPCDQCDRSKKLITVK
jgi:hypothetical protein